MTERNLAQKNLYELHGHPAFQGILQTKLRTTSFTGWEHSIVCRYLLWQSLCCTFIFATSHTGKCVFFSLILLLSFWILTSQFSVFLEFLSISLSPMQAAKFRRACASAQSRQNLRCSLIQAVSQEEPSDRKPDPWPL